MVYAFNDVYYKIRAVKASFLLKQINFALFYSHYINKSIQIVVYIYKHKF
jgi:hypothetical protein